VRVLVAALERLDLWADAVDGLRVLPGTALAGDDRGTAYETLSSQVRSHLGVAIDHMRTLREVAISARSLPAMAGFTPTRAALEGVGTSLWLLGPASRDERVIRSLQLASEGHRDALVAEAELRGQRFEASEDRVTRRLVELRDQRTGLANHARPDPPFI
jgi:hypothetical protein